MKKYSLILMLCFTFINSRAQQPLPVEVFETSEGGRKLERIRDFAPGEDAGTLTLQPKIKYQSILGFGGAFTESSAFLLNKLSSANRSKIIKAYFSDEGARYSLTRTHMNSCDFSLGQYSYAPVAGDKNLTGFSIEEDRPDLIPMIKEAMKASANGFKIIASPWTAPPWMKDNNHWVGGKLLPEYRETWALFFSKYLKAYQAEGIDIWGFTVINEPNGNGNNWESMLFTPAEMTDFVQHYLGPRLKNDGYSDVKILGYDQNRGGVKEWSDVMYKDKQSARYYDGMAIHWYESTYDVFGDALQYAHAKSPHKYIIQTEACVDAEVPHWQDDAWYWSKEGTDWGWDWASEKEKYLHPKYVPVFRYAGDIIGCMNNWVNGWIDWNMVLDRQGGPNWFKNWCVAPVIVDPEKDEVYFTPIYYTMAHFSRFIVPGAKVIKLASTGNSLMATAAINPDKSVVVIVLNQGGESKQFTLALGKKSTKVSISAKSLQTIVIRNQ